MRRSLAFAAPVMLSLVVKWRDPPLRPTDLAPCRLWRAARALRQFDTDQHRKGTRCPRREHKVLHYYDPRCTSSVKEITGFVALGARAIVRTLERFPRSKCDEERNIEDIARSESVLASIFNSCWSMVSVPNQTDRGAAFAMSAIAATMSLASRRTAAIRRATFKSRRKRRSRTWVPIMAWSKAARRCASFSRMLSATVTCELRTALPTPINSKLAAKQIIGIRKRRWVRTTVARSRDSDQGAARRFIVSRPRSR